MLLSSSQQLPRRSARSLKLAVANMQLTRRTARSLAAANS